MDPFERDATPNLSMRQKSALKRRITREHNSNFRAGYININEQYLHKTGIRGRKRYFLYCLIVLLFFVAIVNALLTTAVIYFLRISPQHGMEAIEYIPDHDLLRFIGKTMFETVQIFNGKIGSRANKDLYIEGNNNSVIITDTASAHKAPSLSVGPQSTSIDFVESLSMINSKTKKEMFSTRQDVTLQIDGDVTNLKSHEIMLHNMTSKAGIPNLILESIGNHVTLSGSEGVDLMSTEESVILYAERHEVHLRSTNSDIILDAAGGIRFDTDHMPKVTGNATQGALTYKLCVCIPQGRLFAVPVTEPGIGCDNANTNDDPCQ